MTDYIDRCLDEGLKARDEYYEVIETTENGGTISVSDGDPEVCVHEAGHAVMGYLQGRRIKHDYAGPFHDAVWGDLAGQVGYEDGDHPYPKTGDEADEAQWMKESIMSTMAAGFAQCHFDGGNNPARYLSLSDESAIYGNWLLEYCNLIGAFENPPFDMPDAPSEEQEERWWEWTEEVTNEVEAKLWAEVKNMLLDYWHLVEGLAAVLYADPYLDGPEVYEVFDRIQARHAASK
jgi:hypothetical protein